MKYIHQYTRDRRGNLNGVVLATKDISGKVAFGWALCCKKDKFDKQMGLNIALNRALVRSAVPIPNSIRKDVNNMFSRAARYYKDSA